MNLAIGLNDDVARTDPEVLQARAADLAALGTRSVLELCVGPSLRAASTAYAEQGITCTGNDVDRRWKSFYPAGTWQLGDCLSLDYAPYDVVVFAPPLSRGCTGRRDDALRISEVTPSYTSFLQVIARQAYTGVIVLVLPARSTATSSDRSEYHALLAHLTRTTTRQPIGRFRHAGRRGILKYVDVVLP